MCYNLGEEGRGIFGREGRHIWSGVPHLEKGGAAIFGGDKEP